MWPCLNLPPLYNQKKKKRKKKKVSSYEAQQTNKQNGKYKIMFRKIYQTYTEVEADCPYLYKENNVDAIS